MKRKLLCRICSFQKSLLTRGFSFFLLFLTCILPSTGFSMTQGSKTVTLEMKQASIQQVMTRITDTFGFDFVYRTSDLPSGLLRDYTFHDSMIGDVMDQLLEGTNLQWEHDSGVVAVFRQSASQQIPSTTTQAGRKQITGNVSDASTGMPIAGASVMAVGTQLGSLTDAQGNFVLEVPADCRSLEFRFLGYQSQILQISGRSTFNVSLEVDNINVDVVTIVPDGITQRRAESYTGSAVTFKKDDLFRVGNGNVFQSLRNLDPSIYIMDNFDMGSDPNSLPAMSMRGTTAFSDASSVGNLKGNYQNVPNMPLFILDGFEASTEKVFDLDMNRIETITILKDAAAKALYGSKAANGVIIIESLKLNSNKPMISYIGSLDLQMPDLSSYNLCNAIEKLDIELSELYREGMINERTVEQLEAFYKKRKMVLDGLDTDWMSKPVRFGYGHKHSVTAEMGQDDLRVLMGLNFTNTVGTMKGSDRNNVSGNVAINYRLKRFRFSNNVSFTQVSSHDSPFGDYSQYSKINPYESPYDEFGVVKPFINNKSNPYYDGLIKTKFERSYRELTNNTEIEWRILDNLIVRGRLGLTTNDMKASDYYPANHSTQVDPPDTREENRRPADERGLYRVNNGDMFNINGNFTVNYNLTLNEKHYLFATAYMDISEKESQEVIHEAIGLPSDNMDDILFALKYNNDSRPTGVATKERAIGVAGIFSYTYDNRFISDFTIRSNATSIFGVDKRWATFWSAGVGWNLHREQFLRNRNIRELKLRGSVGTSGDQNFVNNKSLAVYEYILGERYNGRPGAWLSNMENPTLQWQQRLDYNAGLDANLFGVMLSVDLYRSVTQNMVTPLAIAPSTGFSTVSENIGKVENKGYEIKANYRVYQKGRDYININASIAGNTNKILKISEAMRTYNESIMAQYTDRENLGITGKDESKSLLPALMYVDGYDMNSIRAVRSAGIDPATGVEALIGADGRLTYIYRGSDLQVCGTTSPKYRGTFGFNGEIKGIGMSVTCTYLGGGQYYNSTLMNKIENISIYENFDRRALTERWNGVDHKAYFKKLSEWTGESYHNNQSYDFRNGIYWYSNSGWAQELTRATSRFVQDRNELTISQISVYYDFDPKMIKKLGMSRLKITAYMNDVATFSTIGIERGTSYPFARILSFSLNATF